MEANRKLVFLPDKINVSGVGCDSWKAKTSEVGAGYGTGDCVIYVAAAAA